MRVHTKVPLTRWLFIATLSALASALGGIRASAQDVDPRWVVAGEAGGIVGGRWLRGGDVPTISSSAGAELSLRATRGAAPHVDLGAAVRIAAQGLQFRQNADRWSGPTLASGALVGLASMSVHQSDSWRSAIDLGAGLAWFSGARNVYPFSSASQVAPVVEAGVSLRHLPGDGGPAHRRSLIGQTGFFARYELTRLDPGATPVGAPGATGVAGTVGRIAVGLRVER